MLLFSYFYVGIILFIMNNVINFYYGINTMDISEIKEGFSFNYNENNYYLVEYDRSEKELKGLIDICFELKKRNILTNEFIINKYNNYLTPYNGKKMILIKQKTKEYNIDLNDILYVQNSSLGLTFDKNISRNNFIDLWKNKIDFHEAKVNSNYRLIYKTIDYYIGLGENAISYVTTNNIKTTSAVLSHRRLKMDSLDFYNPLNYVIDSRARDFAEYIKEMLFFRDVSDDLIISFFNYANFTRDECILFISRMLYPTYFFDAVDRVILYNENEEIIRPILDQNDRYLRLLKKIFYHINYDLGMNIPLIEWIIKK